MLSKEPIIELFPSEESFNGNGEGKLVAENNNRSNKTAAAHNRGVEKLFHKYHRILMGFLKDRLIDKQEAEDVAQEIYYRLSRRVDIPYLEHPKAFLLQTATNLLVDLSRARVRKQASFHIGLEESEYHLQPGPLNPELESQAAEELELIAEALAQLGAKTQAIFIMHRLDGATYTEIAETFGITASAVEKHISKVLVHLRCKLKKSQGEAL